MVAPTAPAAATFFLSLFKMKFSALFCLLYKVPLKYSLYKNFHTSASNISL